MVTRHPLARLRIQTAHAWSLWGLVLALLVAACDGDMTPPSDAAVDASDDGGDAGATGVVTPALPEMTPCPGGWAAVSTEWGVDVCEPYESGVMDCSPQEAHFPGTAGCAPVGAPCPTGDFAEDLPTDREIVYVREGEVAGDGSLAQPFGTIPEALAAAPRSAVIAIGKGTYEAGFLVRGSVTFWGACAAETVLTAEANPDGDAVLEIRAGNVDVRNMTIGPSGRPGIMARIPNASVDVEGVIIDGVSTTALAALGGGRISGRDVVVRELQNTRGTTRGLIADGGTIELERVIVEGAHEVGIMVAASTGSLRLTDALVRRTLGLDGTLGRGLQVQMGGSAELSRVVFEENFDVGTMVTGGSTARFEDVVIRRTQSRASDGTAGRGLMVQGSTVTLTRVRIDDNREVGLFAGEEPGTEVDATDLVITRTAPSTATGEGGRGINLQHFGAVRLERVLLADNREIGFMGWGTGVTVDATDLSVVRTGPQESDDGLGRGANFESGISVSLTRARFSENRQVGLLVGDAMLTATDLTVADTASRLSDGTGGEALSIQSGAAVDIRSAYLARNAEAGVLVGTGAGLTMRDAQIIDTRTAACAETSCATDPFGIGLGVFLGGHVTLTDFTIRGAPVCGIQIADTESQLDLADGVVAEAAIGSCVQIDGYDLGRLQNSVSYEDNGVNLDSTSLPVPSFPMSGI